MAAGGEQKVNRLNENADEVAGVARDLVQKYREGMENPSGKTY